MLSLLDLKGRVSTEVGSDSYTQLHSASKPWEPAQRAPGPAPGTHQKDPGDLSSSEGVKGSTQHERQLF